MRWPTWLRLDAKSKSQGLPGPPWHRWEELLTRPTLHPAWWVTVDISGCSYSPLSPPGGGRGLQGLTEQHLICVGSGGKEGAPECCRAFVSSAGEGKVQWRGQISSGPDYVGFPWQIRVLSACPHSVAPGCLTQARGDSGVAGDTAGTFRPTRAGCGDRAKGREACWEQIEKEEGDAPHCPVGLLCVTTWGWGSLPQRVMGALRVQTWGFFCLVGFSCFFPNIALGPLNNSMR